MDSSASERFGADRCGRGCARSRPRPGQEPRGEYTSDRQISFDRALLSVTARVSASAPHPDFVDVLQEIGGIVEDAIGAGAFQFVHSVAA